MTSFSLDDQASESLVHWFGSGSGSLVLPAVTDCSQSLVLPTAEQKVAERHMLNNSAACMRASPAHVALFSTGD